jgi:hypothetical protein
MAETTTTETVVRQAPYLEDFQRRLLDYAFARGETPVDIPGMQVAGLDPLTQQAMQTGQGIGQYMNYLTQGAGTLGQGLQALQQGYAGVPGLFGSAADAARGSGQRFGGAGIAGLGQYGGGPQVGGQAQFDPTAVSQYMDPYEDAVVQRALSDIRREGDIAQQGVGARAVGAGAFGGSREGIAGTELARNVLEQQGRTAAGLRSAGYQQAMGQAQQAFEQAQGRRLQGTSLERQLQQQAFERAQGRQLQGTSLQAQLAQQAFEQQQQRQQGIGRLLAGIGQSQSQEAARRGAAIGAFGTQQANLAAQGQGLLGQQAQLQSQLGALGQAQQQRMLDAERQSYLQQAYEPFQRIGFISDIFKPSIGSGQSSFQTATAPSPSPWSQAIGAGIAGFGINKGLDNPFAALFKSFGK